MALVAGRKPKRAGRGALVAALDVGTTKVCCFIARVGENGVLRVLGAGHHGAQGVRNGAIVDMEACATSIGHAVHAAEQMAGETLREVCVNLSGGRPTSQMITSEIILGSHAITDADLRRALVQGRNLPVGSEASLLHAVPVRYTLDGNPGIRDPRGMYGERLGVQMHVVTAAAGTVRTLTSCVARCHLDIDGVLVSSYASGLACLLEEETDLGVACIDMGGGTTTLSVFYDGSLVFVDCVPVGGGHVTSDIARGFSTPPAQAERIKTLHGAAIATPADERDRIEVPVIGEEQTLQKHTVPKSELVGIIQPRLEEIFELVNARLEQSGLSRCVGQRVVLTGGGCQLPGTRELAQLVLNRQQVRIGRPQRLEVAGDAWSGPAFSTAAGLLASAVQDPAALPLAVPEMAMSSGFLSRVGIWLRDNL